MVKSKPSMLRDQRGISLITAIIFVAIALLITIAFLNMDSVSKGWKSGRTADHFNELQTISSNIATVKDRSKLLYGGQIVDANPSFSQSFVSPPVSAYTQTTSVVLNGEQATTANPTPDSRTLSVNSAGMYSLAETGAYQAVTGTGGTAGFQIYDSLNVPIPLTGTTVATKAISNPQPNGQPYLAPLTAVDVEEIDRHLFLGLLKGNDTQLGRALISDDKTGLTTSGNGVKPILSIAFGDAAKRYATSSLPDSWFTLTPVNISALKGTVDLDNNRFLDESKFRLYYVTKIATQENAYKLIDTHPATSSLTPEQKANLKEVYHAALTSVVKDSIIAVPLTENNIVYSEASDYKYYLFGLHD